ncbi:dolichyl-phosphate-mannose--protein mannosyltransferase [Pyrococcus kukulkanii]|uniref:dolichyl-phosphate-mannose--protein mannosyltransferase n=1 Tax=Pyrococcus kukulkanii TaxID=1609559 RepID=UPI0035688093
MDYSILKRRWRGIVFFSYLILLIGGSTYYMIEWAKVEDYMGDEVWYVSATRNMLSLLGVKVKYIENDTGGVNVIYNEPLYAGKVIVYFHGLKFEGLYREYPQLPEFARKLGVRIKVIPFNYTRNESEWENLKLKIWEIAYRNSFTSYTTYSEFPGVYYEIPEEYLKNFTKETEGIKGVRIVPGYRYPDKENIHKYLNTEHPFLGKDLIALGMLINDKPFYWRIPGIVEHALIVMVVVFVTYRLTKSYLASAIAATFSALDPLLFATGIVAMLDIHVAFFVALFMLTIALNRIRLSGFTLGLAAATKLSGAFVFPILWIKILRKKDWKEFILSGVVLPIVGFMIPEIPIIKAIGFIPWFQEFLGSFAWHLSFKGEHPAEAPFWMWFISLKPFPFHYNPDVYAVTDPILMLAMVVFIFAVPYVATRRRGLHEIFWMFWSIVGFFALHYILGGKTQFIFYATPLVPPAAVALGVIGYDIIKWEYFEKSLRMYWKWIKEYFEGWLEILRLLKKLVKR